MFSNSFPNQNHCPRRHAAWGLAKFTGGCAAGAALCWVGFAQAQQDSGTAVANRALEEVVVTARKRTEPLQETPIAVSAFSANDLQQRSLGNLVEVANYAPNVAASSSGRASGGASANVFIRGVGQSDFLLTTDPGVGIYIDGVYYPRTIGGVMDLLELERVEVLRGPQGTLFGKNTIGGAINVISAKPSGEWGGYGEVTLGSDNRSDLRVSMDIPLIAEQLSAKVAFSRKKRDGYGDTLDFNTGAVLEEGLGDEDQTAVRGALRWLVSETLSIDLSIDHSKWNQNSVPTVMAFIDPSIASVVGLWNTVVGEPAGTPYDARYLIPGNVDDSYATGPNVNDFDGWGVNSTVEWNAGWAILKSITAYREFDADYGIDADGSPLAIADIDYSDKQEQTSQEIQLFGDAFDDRLHWQTGIFYFDEFGSNRGDVGLALGLYDALEGLPGPVDNSPLSEPTAPGGPGNPINTFFDLHFDVFNQVEISSAAAFAQGTYDLNDQWSLTAGLRYTHETKEYTLEHKRMASGLFSVPYTVIDDSWNELTPMGSLQYQWSSDLMVYATVSEGFKSGGFNGRPTEQREVESFEPELMTSYEIGVKSEWLQRRLRMNLAAFKMKYKDLQINTVSFSTQTNSLILKTDNIASATVTGLELETRVLLGSGFDIGANLGYLDFDINKLDPSVVEISKGHNNVRTPQWTASTYLQYTWPWENVGEFSVRGDWAYEDDSFNDELNSAPLTRQAHTLFNARVSFDMPQECWQVSLFGTNLTDKRFIDNGSQSYTSFGKAEAAYNRPREWGMAVRKRF